MIFYIKNLESFFRAQPASKFFRSRYEAKGVKRVATVPASLFLRQKWPSLKITLSKTSKRAFVVYEATHATRLILKKHSDHHLIWVWWAYKRKSPNLISLFLRNSGIKYFRCRITVNFEVFASIVLFIVTSNKICYFFETKWDIFQYY